MFRSPLWGEAPQGAGDEPPKQLGGLFPISRLQQTRKTRRSRHRRRRVRRDAVDNDAVVTAQLMCVEQKADVRVGRYEMPEKHSVHTVRRMRKRERHPIPASEIADRPT